MSLLAWLRRLVVSMGIGVMSYAIMLGIMLLSLIYDRELEPVITLAFDTGRNIVSGFIQAGLGKPLQRSTLLRRSDLTNRSRGERADDLAAGSK